MTELFHYGVKRRSGRYPWGSGKRPYQGSSKEISRQTFEEVKRIQSSLNPKEKQHIGNMSISKYTTYVNTKSGAYIILDDYKGEYKKEHPYSGKVIGIAADQNSRGKGITDYLIQKAIKDNQKDTLIAEIDVDNVASRKLFSRNGFLIISKNKDMVYMGYPGDLVIKGKEIKIRK